MSHFTARFAGTSIAASGILVTLFVVIAPRQPVPRKIVLKVFGKPAHTYRFESYTIMVWNKNLLADLT